MDRNTDPDSLTILTKEMSMRRYLAAISAAFCLLSLAGCTTENPYGSITLPPRSTAILPPITTPATPTPSVDTNSPEELLSHARQIYEDYYNLSIHYQGVCGVSPLPEEFKKYLMEDALISEETLMASYSTDSSTCEGTLVGEVTETRQYTGNQEDSTVFAIETCDISGGGKTYDSAGNVLWGGDARTFYVIAYFKFDDDMNLKISKTSYAEVETCPFAEQ
jgi:hypothetical protein